VCSFFAHRKIRKRWQKSVAHPTRLMLELNGAPKILIHLLGATLITGRIIHAIGIPAKNLKKRVLGMQITPKSCSPMANNIK